jgi:steroid delta-isomerase-like uncharacterized protein
MEVVMSELAKMVRTHYDGVESGDLDLATSVFDQDVESVTPNGPMHGLAEFRAFGEVFKKAVPDARLEIVRCYETEHTIIVEGMYTGTQTGPLESPSGTIPASGRSFSFPYVDVLTERDGKFISHRIYWDNVSFLTQLGLMPAPETATA